MYVIGTAGHVDHGKSTLVLALTGIDPDRLAEEKARQMTIDLGFAWLQLPDGREVSIIDVPGHERFIKNMLAGVGGIDAALLVIAADDGPMPQTREHLAILDLLQVRRGVVALSKRDLVDDDWLALVEADIRALLAGSSLADAPIVPVSARSGVGLEELKARLAETLAEATLRPDNGTARLPIDRAFTIAGFGTVVTGTLLDGSLRVGQEVTIAPAAGGTLKGRIRGLQMHKQKLEVAPPGNRVAVNLSGVEVEQLRRGQVLSAAPIEPSDRLDVKLTALPAAPPLEQNAALDLFIGADETTARITVLNNTRIMPGEQGWAQLRLASPVVALRGDRFILRRPSPSDTVAGGVIVEPHPRRHRRFQPGLTAQLETLAKGNPTDLLLATLTKPLDLKTATSAAGLDPTSAKQAASELLSNGRIVALRQAPLPVGGAVKTPLPPGGVGGGSVPPLAVSDYLIAAGAWQTLLAHIRDTLSQYHAQYPLRIGIGKEELRGRLGLESKPFAAVASVALAAGELAEAAGGIYHHPGFRPILSPPQQAKAARLLAALNAAPYAPPAPAELGFSDKDDELLAALVERGDIVRAAGIYFSRAAYQRIEAEVFATIERDGSITIATLRDLSG
ncbi:MAG: selenocysteine-specific translation elongation factor, partial [Candidatus Chloroheliales bacterium]